MSRPRTRWKLLGGGALALALLQLVPVDRSNPPVESDLPSPPGVKAILQRSCYDCHSHESDWPWYATVAPISWMMVHEVGEARSEMNFSTWRAYRPDKRARLLHDLLEEVEEENMPPWYYLVLHPEAELSDSERESLRDWVRDVAG